jgi:hypothetical protein
MTHYQPSLRNSRYLVGEDGSVVGPRGWKLTPSLSGNGYWYIAIWQGDHAESVSLNVLVCETYHGPRPAGMQAAHKDGNRANNSASNLQWKTQLDNDADRDTHGTRPRGETNGKTRLTEGDVRFIRQIHAAGVKTVPEIASIYHLSQSGLIRIINRQRWGHVQ